MSRTIWNKKIGRKETWSNMFTSKDINVFAFRPNLKNKSQIFSKQFENKQF